MLNSISLEDLLHAMENQYQIDVRLKSHTCTDAPTLQ